MHWFMTKKKLDLLTVLWFRRAIESPKARVEGSLNGRLILTCCLQCLNGLLIYMSCVASSVYLTLDLNGLQRDRSWQGCFWQSFHISFLSTWWNTRLSLATDPVPRHPSCRRIQCNTDWLNLLGYVFVRHAVFANLLSAILFKFYSFITVSSVSWCAGQRFSAL